MYPGGEKASDVVMVESIVVYVEFAPHYLEHVAQYATSHFPQCFKSCSQCSCTYLLLSL